MTFPYFPNKYEDEGTTSAIDIFINSNGVKSLSELPKPPKSCIFCPSDFITKYLSKSNELKEGPRIIHPIRFLSEDLAIFSGFVGFGAPMWAWILEQMIAYGITNFIYIGFFGNVNSKTEKNKYIQSSKWAYPDENLTKKLLSNKEETVGSKIWSTDAMFKQTKKEINYANENEIIGFDMETSALFSIAKVKGCKIASIQIESDSFINNKWESVYKTKKFEDDFIKAINLAIKVLDN